MWRIKNIRKIKWFAVSIIVALSLNACHNSRILTGKHKALKPEQIIAKYHNSDSFPLVASFRFNAEVISNESSQSANCYIRMFQDSLIWISIRSMSFEGLRAVITPDSVKFIDRINNKYYLGGYDFVTKISPMELDFNNVQNILLGKIVDYQAADFQNLKPCNDSLYYCLNYEPNNEIRYDTIISAFDKDYVSQKYLFHPENFLLTAQVFKSLLSKEILAIYYGNYKNFNSVLYPQYIRFVISGYQESEIKLETKNIAFDSDFKTPFKIPDKFQAISF